MGVDIFVKNTFIFGIIHLDDTVLLRIDTIYYYTEYYRKFEKKSITVK